MLVIETAATHAEDLSSLEEYLAGLGRKHRAVGVRLSSFSVGSGVLSYSRAPELQPPLSPSPPPPKSIDPPSTSPVPQMTRDKGLL